MRHRRVQVLNLNGLWVDIELDKIKENDVFRLFDENSDKLIVDGKRRKQWTASCSPFINKYKELVINVY